MTYSSSFDRIQELVPTTGRVACNRLFACFILLQTAQAADSCFVLVFDSRLSCPEGHVGEQMHRPILVAWWCQMCFDDNASPLHADDFGIDPLDPDDYSVGLLHPDDQVLGFLIQTIVVILRRFSVALMRACWTFPQRTNTMLGRLSMTLLTR